MESGVSALTNGFFLHQKDYDTCQQHLHSHATILHVSRYPAESPNCCVQASNVHFMWIEECLECRFELSLFRYCSRALTISYTLSFSISVAFSFCINSSSSHSLSLSLSFPLSALQVHFILQSRIKS